MTNLGKFITAAGGAMIAVFSLVAMIVVLAADFTPTSIKVNAVFQGIILIALGGAVVAGSLMMFDRACKCLVGLGLLATFLASTLSGSVLVPASGGIMFYVLLGGLVTATGSCHSCLCGPKSCGQAGTAPPESKL